MCTALTAHGAGSSYHGVRDRPTMRQVRRATQRHRQHVQQEEQHYADRFQQHLSSQTPFEQESNGASQVRSEKGGLVRFGSSAAGVEDQAEVRHIQALTVGKLRQYLKDREAACPGCVEKLHLIERAMQVRGWETETSRVARQLTPTQHSAGNALSPQHLAEGIALDPHGNPIVPTTQSKAQIEAIQLSHGIHCQAALPNGTQYCHQVGSDDDGGSAM